MRPLLLALCLLLTACNLTVAPPPPRTESELLYRTLALQNFTRTVWLDGVERAAANTLPGNEGASLSLLLMALLGAVDENLQKEFPTSLQAQLSVAQAQHEALVDLARRIFVHQELSAQAAIAELTPLDTEGALSAYSRWLLWHGYLPDDIAQMADQWQEDMRQALSDRVE